MSDILDILIKKAKGKGHLKPPPPKSRTQIQQEALQQIIQKVDVPAEEVNYALPEIEETEKFEIEDSDVNGSIKVNLRVDAHLGTMINVFMREEVTRIKADSDKLLFEIESGKSSSYFQDIIAKPCEVFLEGNHISNTFHGTIEEIRKIVKEDSAKIFYIFSVKIDRFY